MDGVCDGAIEYLAVGEGLLAQLLPATPFTCSTTESPRQQSSSRQQNTPLAPSGEKSRRSSLTEALQWFMKPMNTSSSAAISRDINVLTPQST